MKIIALDSQALIDAERKSPGILKSLKRWNAEGCRLSVSAVALAEWCVGWHAVKDPDRKARASRFFEVFVDPLPVQHVVKQDALRTGEIIGRLKAQGITLDLADALIGCQAARRGLAMVTGNVGHFSRIPGLEVVDPNEEAPRALTGQHTTGDAKGQRD